MVEPKIKEGEKAISIEKRLKSKYLKIPYIPELSFRGGSECLEYDIKDHLLKDLKIIIQKDNF